MQLEPVLLQRFAHTQGDAAAAASNLDIGAIIQSVAGGGVGGGIVVAIVGAIKKALAK